MGVQEAAELHFTAMKRVHCPQLQWNQASQGLASKLGGVSGIGIGIPASAANWGANLPEGVGIGVNQKALNAAAELSSSLSQYLTASVNSWSMRLRRATSRPEE